MAQINNLQTLVNTVVHWSDRQDIDVGLILQFTDFTSIVAEQVLRTRYNKDVDTLLSSNNQLAVPVTLEELSSLSVIEGGKPTKGLEYIPWDIYLDMDSEESRQAHGPTSYTRDGDSIYIYPGVEDGTPFRMSYYKKIPKLTLNQTTNWLLREYPQVYVFGCLKYLYEFVMDETRGQYWENKFTSELSRIQALHEVEQHRGSTLVVGRSR
jgi:hypothetical protein